MTTDNIIDSQEMNQKVSPVNIAFKWAFIGVLLSIIQTMVAMFLNDGKFDPNKNAWAWMGFTVVLVIVILFMSMKEYRDKALGGYATYGKLFYAGFMTSLFWILFTAVFLYIFYNFIIDWDTFMAEQMDKGMERMKEKGMTEEQIQKAMNSLPAMFRSQWFSLLSSCIAGLVIDIIICLILAAFVKKDRPHS